MAEAVAFKSIYIGCSKNAITRTIKVVQNEFRKLSAELFKAHLLSMVSARFKKTQKTKHVTTNICVYIV